MNRTWGAFARRLLVVGGWPEHQMNHTALVAWMRGEGTAAQNNPFATTHPWPGSNNFNFADVKNYATWENGVAATVATIKLTRYAAIAGCLKNHDPASVTLAAVRSSGTWTHFGGEDLDAFVEAVRASWSTYAFKTVKPFVKV